MSTSGNKACEAFTHSRICYREFFLGSVYISARPLPKAQTLLVTARRYPFPIISCALGLQIPTHSLIPQIHRGAEEPHGRNTNKTLTLLLLSY